MLGVSVYAVAVLLLGHPAAAELLEVLRPAGPVGDAPRRPRVAVDMTFAEGSSGTSRYVTALVNALEHSDQIELVRCRSPRLRRMPRVLRVAVNGLLHLVWSQIILPLSAWRQRIDVIHGTMTGPLHAPCPLVVTVHDALDFHSDLRPSRVWSFYMRTLGAWTARRADAVLTGTAASAGEIRRFFRVPRQRLHVVPYGNALSGTSARAIPGFDVSRRFALAIATANRRKNAETAVAATQLVRQAGTDVDLVVIGALPTSITANRPWLRSFASVDDDELHWLYTHAAAVLVPSRHEGFGLPVVEALALGAPVVASAIPALLEVGEGIRFADPDDPSSFAAQLTQVLGDVDAEVERLRPARTRASAMTWEATAAGTIAIYSSLTPANDRSQAWLSTAAF
jgi:glycosyltransferase involved in cell wall biosynthesis